MSPVRVIGVLTLALLTTACAKTTLDTTGVQKTIREQLEATLGQKLTVTCPSPELKVGGIFDCTVTGPSSGTLTVQVTQTDDRGNVTWKIVAASIPSATPTQTPSPTEG